MDEFDDVGCNEVINVSNKLARNIEQDSNVFRQIFKVELQSRQLHFRKKALDK